MASSKSQFLAPEMNLLVPQSELDAAREKLRQHNFTIGKPSGPPGKMPLTTNQASNIPL